MPTVKHTDLLHSAEDEAEDNKPALYYWQLWTDNRGISHQTRCTLTAFEQQSMGGAALQWNHRQTREPTSVLFSVLPAGWIGDWHENPRPQWIIPISGVWFVESMDGRRIEMGAGELSFGGDQYCVPDLHGHKGHRSGTVGDQSAVLMIVQFEQLSQPAKPGCVI
ncbi:MAG: hypothetical protein ACYCSS_05025 [Sulfuriferula sp.]